MNIIQVWPGFPVDTGRKLNVHKTFRGRPGSLLHVLCAFNLRPVFTGPCMKITTKGNYQNTNLSWTLDSNDLSILWKCQHCLHEEFSSLQLTFQCLRVCGNGSREYWMIFQFSLVATDKIGLLAKFRFYH